MELYERTEYKYVIGLTRYRPQEVRNVKVAGEVVAAGRTPHLRDGQHRSVMTLMAGVGAAIISGTWTASPAS